MRLFFHPAREDIALPSVLYALSDPIRLKIVAQLAAAGHEISTGDCLVGEDLAKSTYSHHFKVLREAGITHTNHRGTRLLVSIRTEDLDARFPGLLETVLSAFHATVTASPDLIQE